MPASIVFWFSALLAAYVYAGYPALLWILQLVFRRPVRKGAHQPDASLLIAAYNEAGVIEAKIRNALALDYPPERLEIAVASDGSTDGTAEIARRVASGPEARGRVVVFDYPRNRGKLAVLNETVPKLSGSLVFFSDASSMLAPDALLRLAACFADPEVGAASGIYRVRKKDEALLGRQEDFYWKYEIFLKRQEAALGSVLGGHGSLYAIRRDLYPFPEPGIINDDYIIPVRILQRGYRVAYEPLAVACEEAHEMGGFSRRVRIMTGNVLQLGEMRALLRPLRPLSLFFFLSHKAGRLAVPFAMAAMALSNLALLDSPLYRAFGWLQAAFYGLAALGGLAPLRPRLLRLPFYFTMINAAAFCGIYHALRGRRGLVWKQK